MIATICTVQQVSEGYAATFSISWLLTLAPFLTTAASRRSISFRARRTKRALNSRTAKLDTQEEKALAEEGLLSEIDAWPAY